MIFAPEPLCTGDPPPRVPGTGPIPFAGRGEDLEWLADAALRVATGNLGNVFGALLALLAGCRSAPHAAASMTRGPTSTQLRAVADVLAKFIGCCSEPWTAERRGACYAHLQAVADEAGMDGERAEDWAGLAASIPLKEHHIPHILGALTEDAP